MWHENNFWLYLFGFVILLVLINNVFAAIKRGQTLSALRRMQDSGKEIPPDLAKTLENAEMPHDDNLKGGVVLIAVSLGLIVMGYVLREGVLADDPDGIKALQGLTAAAVIPGFIGVALLFLHVIRGKRK